MAERDIAHHRGIGAHRLADDAHSALVTDYLDRNPVVHTFGLGHLDPDEFTLVISAAHEYVSTAGARRGGVAGQAFTTYRMAVLASRRVILVFQGGEILGWAEWADETWARVADFDFHAINQVNPVTGETTFPAEQ